MFDRGRLKDGETILVHGGSSGIGTTAIQLAKAFGARVFATAGSAEKRKVCEDLGAERAINYREEDFVEVMNELGGADVILDMVGGSYIQRNVDTLKVEGQTLPDRLSGAGGREFQFPQDAGPPADTHRVNLAAPHRGPESRDRRKPEKRRSGRCWRKATSGRSSGTFPLAEAANPTG